MDCPKCGNEIGRAKACGCGWKAIGARELSRQANQPLGYTQCEWESASERCRYPATIDGRWCGGHYGCDPHMGGYVVEASRDYVHLTIQQRIDRNNERLIASSKVYLAKHGLTKREGESSKDYIGRLRQHVRERFGIMVQKQRAA